MTDIDGFFEMLKEVCDELPDDAEFFEDMPTETEAGDYYVWFTIGGDPNGTVFPNMGPFRVTIESGNYLDSTVNVVVDIGAAVYNVTVNNGSLNLSLSRDRLQRPASREQR